MSHVFSHPIEVRFRDCDLMGHVNNAVYFTYFEQARFAYFHQVIGMQTVDETGFILARNECDYRSAATLGDVLEVRLRVAAIGRSSFTFEYEVVDRKSGRQIATARSVQVCYDYREERSIPVPDELRAKLERDLAAV